MIGAAGFVIFSIGNDRKVRSNLRFGILQVLLVFSVFSPPWDPQMATRFLVASEAAGIPVLVLLNKADLVSGDQLASIVRQVRAWCLLE